MASKTAKKPPTPENLVDEFVKRRPRLAPSILASLKTMGTGRDPPKRVERPSFPKRRGFTVSDQWISLRWMIDTAELQGTHALRGLTLALARMIQADAFKTLFLDARPYREPLGDIDELLWDQTKPVTRDGKCLAHVMTRRRLRDQIDLATTAVIAKIWEPWRVAKSLQNLGSDRAWGAWRQDQNHHAFSWHPWPLVWVYNGNHSVTAATLRGGGTLKCEASFDVSPLLQIVTTDGQSWFGEDRIVLGPVRSLPMAGIMEIGRRLSAPKARIRDKGRADATALRSKP